MSEALEKVYDEQIAPLLMQAAKIAEANGMAVVAYAQWGDSLSGMTFTLPQGAWAGARVAYYAAKCAGNVDSLCIALVRDGREHGHRSMFLDQLGVKLVPR